MKKADRTKIIKAVATYCDKKDIRLTEPRKLVLEIIANATRPIVAYDVLAALAKKMPNPKPPTAYRAIDFLIEHQFIHRIESLNAYIVCTASHRHEGSQFMICDNCGEVEEAHLCHLPATLAEKTTAHGFGLSSWNVELHGTCKNCVGHAPRQYSCHSHDHL